MLIPTVIDSDGSSTLITGNGRGSSGSASVSPIITSGMPATAISSPGPCLVDLDPFERLADIQLGHLRALDRAVRATPGDVLRAADRALLHPAEREPTDVRRSVEVGHERLQWMPSS